MFFVHQPRQPNEPQVTVRVSSASYLVVRLFVFSGIRVLYAFLFSGSLICLRLMFLHLWWSFGLFLMFGGSGFLVPLTSKTSVLLSVSRCHLHTSSPKKAACVHASPGASLRPAWCSWRAD